MNLLSELRQKIRDVRHVNVGLTLGVVDAASAIAEVTEGRLITSISGGTAPDLNIGLSDSRYNTIGRLHQALCRSTGYVSNLDDDANTEHSSMDIMSFGPTPFAETGIPLMVRRFSDAELESILDSAITRHNPSFTIDTLPPAERVFVLQLAQAEVYRAQAYDSSKRRGLTVEPNNLIRLAESMESAYADDVSRLARAIQSPKEANPNTMNDGDFVMATFRRHSLRTGRSAPLSSANVPDPVVLVQPEDDAVEDDNVKITWERNKNPNFYSYELYVDSRDHVERPEPGRMTTSQLVIRSTGASARTAASVGSGFSAYYEEVGQLTPRFVVQRLEPQTTYFFRLYVSNVNGLMSSSSVVRATTLPLRTRFRRLTADPDRPTVPTGPYMDVSRGPAGTEVAVYLDEGYGEFTSEHRLKIGEKEVTPTIVGPYEVTFEVPSFQFLGVKDLVVISPTGLLDVRERAFTVIP